MSLIVILITNIIVIIVMKGIIPNYTIIPAYFTTLNAAPLGKIMFMHGCYAGNLHTGLHK
jgi:hypothetical protein